MKKKITILCSYKDRLGMVLFYSLFPLLRKKHIRTRFEFTNSLDYCLHEDPNDCLLIINYIEDNHRFEDINTTSILKRLRGAYQRIALFDDTARPALVFPDALPLVDVYFKKQLFKDRELYSKKIYRGQLFADHFHRRKGIEDQQKKDRYDSRPVDSEYLSKLHLAWNIGAGCYPRKNLIRKIGIVTSQFLSPKLAPFFYSDPAGASMPVIGGRFDVQARISIPHVETVAFQREEVLRIIQGDSRFLTGFVKQSQYRKEIKQSKIVVSPFGWGEICFRDFETVLNGSLLLKPDMGHIDTWPDIYLPGETYVPFRWDAEDLIGQAERYLEDKDLRHYISQQAFRVYRENLERLDDQADALIHRILGKK